MGVLDARTVHGLHNHSMKETTRKRNGRPRRPHNDGDAASRVRAKTGVQDARTARGSDRHSA